MNLAYRTFYIPVFPKRFIDSWYPTEQFLGQWALGQKQFLGQNGFWANGLTMGVCFLVNYMTSLSDLTRQYCGLQYFWILG